MTTTDTDRLASMFREAFPDTTPRFIIRAPGRVNLIGEHTDYNDGFVLPIAMSQTLYVIAGPASDDRMVVRSTAMPETIECAINNPGPPGHPHWANYVRGVAAMLQRNDITLRPARLLIHSEVPIGGGVSSSAALEVGCAMALLALTGQTLEPVKLALLARDAEHEYAKSPCGIMDQFICVLAQADHALLLDCRTQSYEQLPIPPDAILVVMDTQVKHQLGSSEYPVRQRQCHEGLSYLQQALPGIAALRNIQPAQLKQHESAMDATIFRRCHHVVTEIARTLTAADALRRTDLKAFGRLMHESHVSLRDDYEVSCPELDALVNIAMEIPGVHGARMTGGGFGGCAIALSQPTAVEPLRSAVAAQYNMRFEKPALVYTTIASAGANVHRL